MGSDEEISTDISVSNKRMITNTKRKRISDADTESANERAARDGILNILMEGTEKDCNTGDGDGMTPVHWAAFCGHLSALRLLIGLGGKPEKCDSAGNTALHHAAAGGHLKIVAFLVALGENPWELNANYHTPKVVAAKHGREDVLQYLDRYMGREMASNRQKTIRREERAKKRAEERYPSSRSTSSSSEASCIHTGVPGAPSTTGAPSITSASSRRSSMSTLTGSSLSLFRRRESMISTTTKASSRRGSLSRGNSEETTDGESQLATDEADGKSQTRGQLLWDKLRKAKSPVYKKMKKRREEEVNGGKILKRGDSAEPRLEECSVYFGSSANFLDIHQRSLSQPDILSTSDVGRSILSLNQCEECLGSDGEDEVFHSNSTSMFERPGFGKVAFRQNSVILPASAKTLFGKLQQDLRKRAQSLGGVAAADPDEEDELTPLDAFLMAWGLPREGPALHRAGFNLESLMEADDEDLRLAGILMGPRKKLINAIEKRRAVIESPSTSIVVSRL